MKKLILLVLVAIISSCQNAKIDRTYPENPENIRKQRAGKFFENDLAVNINNQKNNSKKSSALWTASIEVISGLLPLVTADENSGLIITEWYQDGQNQSDRIKINLLVKGEKAIDENLILTIFRQTKNDKGAWIDEQSANQNLSVKMIKEKIIEKAKK